MSRRKPAGEATNAAAKAAGKAYHHGDLSRALVDAAIESVEADGLEGLSLRKVARAAGVSQAAPYAHFADKQALLSAVAERGLRELSASMAETARGTRTPAARVRALARGYVRFATARPALFRLTFSWEKTAGLRDAALAEAGAEAYGMIEQAVAAYREKERSSRVSNAVAATAAWALVHGLATLVVDEMIDAPSSAGELEDALIDPVAGLLLSGL